MFVFSVLCGFPVAGSQAQITYCAASGGCDEYISMVSVGTINNPSSCGGYQDFTTLSTIMVPGMSYPITVSNGNPIYPDDQCGIWVIGIRTGISMMILPLQSLDPPVWGHTRP
jgi:hypothetical protein